MSAYYYRGHIINTYFYSTEKFNSFKQIQENILKLKKNALLVQGYRIKFNFGPCSNLPTKQLLDKLMVLDHIYVLLAIKKKIILIPITTVDNIKHIICILLIIKNCYTD